MRSRSLSEIIGFSAFNDKHDVASGSNDEISSDREHSHANQSQQSGSEQRSAPKPAPPKRVAHHALRSSRQFIAWVFRKPTTKTSCAVLAMILSRRKKR